MYLDFLQADYSEGCVVPPPAAAALVCRRRTRCASMLASLGSLPADDHDTRGPDREGTRPPLRRAPPYCLRPDQHPCLTPCAVCSLSGNAAAELQHTGEARERPAIELFLPGPPITLSALSSVITLAAMWRAAATIM